MTTTVGGTSGTGGPARLAAAAVAFAALSACGGGGGGDSTGPGTTTAEVGPSGGTATLLQGAVRVNVPAGALDAAVTITAQTTSDVPSDGLVAGSATYELGPAGTQFAQPVTLTLGYSQGSLPAGVRESELRLFKVVGSAWQLMPGGSVNEGANTVSGQVTSFSKFGVRALSVGSVAVAPATSQVEVGGTVQLSATPAALDGTPLTQRSVAWASSNTAVATVDNSGKVTAVAAGQTTITATSGGVSGTASVAVSPPPNPVTTVVVSPPSTTLTVGATVQLTASASGPQGPVTGLPVTWESSNNGIATVSTGGLVTAVATGNATITARISGVAGTASITVGFNVGAFAGTWNGTWFNNTFGSTGPAQMVVTINQQAQTMQLTLDLGGNVFGGSDPPSSTFNGTYTANSFTVTGNSATFGNVTLSGSANGFAGEGTNVPGGVVSRVTFTGTYTTTQVTLNYQVFAPGSQTAFANGVMTMNKQ